jgi:hypothetical protein
MAIFALPFIGVGIWAVYSISSTLLEAHAMQSWAPVQARVISAGVDEHRDDESTTYRAVATYEYTFQGKTYTASRVGIDTGADNIGDWHESHGREIESAQREGRSIEAYVDPDAPYSAIIYRDIRWGMVAFKAVFMVAFGGGGLALLLAVPHINLRRNGTPNPLYQAQPWLANQDWHTAEVRSTARGALYFAWIFAVIWNAISAPMPFMVYGEVTEKQNYAALIGLLFPLVGIGLLVWAVRRTLEWRRFGASPVTLDPFPAAIGGQAGGTFELPVPFDSSHQFRVTLSAVHSFESGSGKNRSRREKTHWEKSVIGYAEPGLYGTRVQFRFDIPEGLPPSDAAKLDDDYDLWRLSLQADLPGADVDRDYEIPAYPGTAKSRIGDRAAAAIATATKTAAENDVRARITLDGDDMFYPMGRNALSCLIGIVIGAVFAGIGVFLFIREDAWFGGAIFGGVGALLFAGCVYAIANSLTVKRDSMGGGVETVRRLFGIPVKSRYAAIDDIASLHSDSSSAGQKNGRQVKYYRVYGKLKSGGDITLGESFEDEAEAEAAIAFIREKLGIRS